MTVKDADDYFHFCSRNFLQNHGSTRPDKIFCPAQHFWHLERYTGYYYFPFIESSWIPGKRMSGLIGVRGLI